ncbi:integrase core domain protein [Lasius niger]|uniref:Integrase core domain protein n=1 Tax=Lasius niger TaxID=67767 RepID=A0A0J7KEJ5_LASNI|nr:integrase core domain protein [Lasius niger]
MEAELSVYRSCILLGSRVVIPSEERKTVLETLHLTHLGVWRQRRPNFVLKYSETIKVLRELFATHGIPDVIVSDNATEFISGMFQTFLKRNLIRHAKIAPYHPASNAQVKRMMQTMKQALKKQEGGDWSTKIARFLLRQHTTPSATIGVSPAELPIVFARNYSNNGPKWIPAVVTAQSGPVIGYKVPMAKKCAAMSTS